jgi:hypothetical protein
MTAEAMPGVRTVAAASATANETATKELPILRNHEYDVM